MKFSTKYFLIAAIALCVFLQACKKEGIQNIVEGTFVGGSGASTIVIDSTGTAHYESNYIKDTVTVARIGTTSKYNIAYIHKANYTVSISKDLTFSEGSGSTSFSGKFVGNSLHLEGKCGIPCFYSFHGKKQ